MNRPDRYIPALGHDWLTPIYDPVLRWFMRERRFKGRLVREAGIADGDRVLDIGCGTGTLALMVKRTHPGAEVVGLDGDPKVLRIALAKAAEAGLDLQFDLGMSYRLPYPDGSFDRVLSTMMFHHLSAEDKGRTASEALRVLRRGGGFHVVDFGPPRGLYPRAVAAVASRFEEVAPNLKGVLPLVFREAGFEGVEETGRFTTVAGGLSFYRARKAGAGEVEG
jgi:ubiquinone/menaquinone biosynthesis C-methylase UbiE